MLAFLRESQVSFTNSQAEQDVRMLDKGATEGLGQGSVQAAAQDFVPLRRVLSNAWKPRARPGRARRGTRSGPQAPSRARAPRPIRAARRNRFVGGCAHADGPG